MRIAIIGSTRGTNFVSLMAAIAEKTLRASIEVVISNKANALILTRAEALNVPHFVIQQEDDITQLLEKYQVDLVILSGYMKILTEDFVKRWKNKVINVHPSLLPAYAGMMDLAVHRAVLQNQESETGCTVHYITEEVDNGEIILQKKIAVHADDTPELLKQRVQALEATALIESIHKIAQLIPPFEKRG